MTMNYVRTYHVNLVTKNNTNCLRILDYISEWPLMIIFGIGQGVSLSEFYVFEGKFLFSEVWMNS